MKKIKKHYRIRPYSPIWWLRAIVIAAAIIIPMGLMNSWELGLL